MSFMEAFTSGFFVVSGIFYQKRSLVRKKREMKEIVSMSLYPKKKCVFLSLLQCAPFFAFKKVTIFFFLFWLAQDTNKQHTHIQANRNEVKTNITNDKHFRCVCVCVSTSVSKNCVLLRKKKFCPLLLLLTFFKFFFELWAYHRRARLLLFGGNLLNQFQPKKKRDAKK